MIKEIELRRSIRKYKTGTDYNKIPKKVITEMVYAATLAPSAKNRQPWKFIVFEGDKKDELARAMRLGIEKEKEGHFLMKKWAYAIPDAENTMRVMEQAPVLIAVINTNGYTPFTSIEGEDRIVEICDSLSIGAAIENMILTGCEYGIGTLWISNTCFAYDALTDYIGTDNQLTGIVALGYADEKPEKRPRKNLEDVLEFV